MTGLDYLCTKAGLGDVAAALSNGTELRAEAKSPLAPAAAESAQSPSATAQTCCQAATPRRGGR